MNVICIDSSSQSSTLISIMTGWTSNNISMHLSLSSDLITPVTKSTPIIPTLIEWAMIFAFSWLIKNLKLQESHQSSSPKRWHVGYRALGPWNVYVYSQGQMELWHTLDMLKLILHLATMFLLVVSNMFWFMSTVPQIKIRYFWQRWVVRSSYLMSIATKKFSISL